MSILNLQLHSISFFDNKPSNNPMLRHFDLTYKLMGQKVDNPEQKIFLIPPQTFETIYDGTRANSINSLTEFDVTKPYIDKDIYRFTWNGVGANPAFRIDRNIGITTSTQFSVTVNGPIATFTLTAGPFVTTNIQVGDILLILSNAGCSASNQGRYVILSKTTNSITVKNLDAVVETFTISDVDHFLIFSNGGSSNAPQIKDTLLISGGFSQATWGSYEILEVTPTWIEIAVGLPNGIPLQTNIAPTPSNFVIYKKLKRFVLIATQSPISVRFNDHAGDEVVVAPLDASYNSPELPGLLLKCGDFYKLTLNNNSIFPAQVLVATAE